MTVSSRADSTRSDEDEVAAEHRAFLSHSHADARLAKALEEGLEQLAKPRRTPKIFDVFLDAADLAGGGQLPDRIATALAHSDFLLVLLSPSAAASDWVNEEARIWLDTRTSTDRVMLALAEGDLVWERRADGPDGWSAASLAFLPGPLHDAFPDEPLWVDLRAFSGLNDDEAADRLTLDHAEFKYNVARLQAPLRGPNVKPSDIVGKDLELHRAAEKRRLQVIVGLAVLTVLSILGGLGALWFANRSAAQEREARSEQLASQSIDSSGSQLDLGLLLAVAAVDVDDNVESFGRLVNAAARAEDIRAIGHEHDRPVRAVAVSDDGAMIATADTGGEVYIWSGDVEPLAGPLPVSFGASTSIQDLDFEPNGERLLAAGHDGAIHRWDVADPSNPEQLEPFVPFDGRSVASIEFAPNGEYLVAAGGVARNGTCTATDDRGRPVDSPIVRLDVETGATDVLGVRKGCVLALDVSVDGDHVAVGDQLGVVAVYDLTGETPGVGFEAHPGSVVSDVELHSDGRRIVSAGWDGDVHVWDLSALAAPTVTFSDHTDIVRSVALSPDGAAVASADREHHIEIWDVETGRVLHRMSAEHAAEVRGVEFVGGDRLVSVATDRKVVLWSPFGGRRVSTSLAAADGRAVAFDEVNTAAISAGGGIDVSAPYSSNADLPGFVESTPIGAVGTAHRVSTSSPVYAVDVRDGIVGIGMLDGSVELHDLDGAGLVRRWQRSDLECPDDGENGVRALSFGDESGAVAVGFFDGTMLVIDDPFEDAEIRCEQADGPVWDLAFRPGDDQIVASNGDERIAVWSLDDDSLTTVPIGTEIVRSVTFDADGSLLATGSSDGDVVVFDADGFDRVGQPFSVHTAAVLDLSFHPDRPILASVSADESVVLWNLRTGLALTDPPIGMDALVRSITWLPEGDGFVVASTDDVEVWDTREPVLVDAVCEAVGRDLTQYERRAFVDESRGTTCDD